MREVLELPEIKDAEIVDGKVRVETKDNVFADVMSTVVNIFRRVAGGCELSFVGFAYRLIGNQNLKCEKCRIMDKDSTWSLRFFLA